MIENTTRYSVRAERVRESAVLRPRINQEYQAGLANPTKALQFLRVQNPSKGCIKLRQAMHGIHDDPVASGRRHREAYFRRKDVAGQSFISRPNQSTVHT